MRELFGLFIAARPVNCLITYLSVWIAGILAGNEWITAKLVIAGISAALIAAFGNIINDVYDLEIDRINKPYRPLLQWNVSRSTASVFAIVLAIAGICLSFFVHKYGFLISIPVVAMLWAYTPIFKGASFLGNIIIASIGASAFLYGGLAAGNPFGAAILIFFAFLLHLGREIVKDIQDRAADIAHGQKTGAVYADSRIARLIASAVFAALGITTIFPWLIGFYGLGYLFGVLLGVDLILIAAIYRLAVSDKPESMRQVAIWLKIAMPFGLLAILLGKFGY